MFNRQALFEKFAKHGVLHRDKVRRQQGALKALMKEGHVVRKPKRRRVYYELTSMALPALETYRQQLNNELEVSVQLTPRSQAYKALLYDVRFLDEKSPEADKFLLLGDWQLSRPLVPAQLTLSKQRFYAEEFKG